MGSLDDCSPSLPVRSFEAGERRCGIALSPDGKMMLSAKGPSDDVSVSDGYNAIREKDQSGEWTVGVITLPD